jgi:hypothetical protein
MAEISPVRDPNFEGFNYSALLDKATSPIDRLGSGQLAIAQQQGQRMFELASERARQSGEARNRIAEIQAESASREQLAKNEALRQKNELAQQKFATAKQIDPNFKPDPDKNLDENMAAADRVREDQAVSAYKSGIDAQTQINKEYEDKLKAAGLPPRINPTELENIVGQKLANDPDFIRSVSPQQRQQLADGTITASQLINSMVGGRFTGWATGLGTGFNPNQTAQNLAQKAQQYRQDVVTAYHQSNLNALGFEGQQALSKYNQQNEINQKLLASLPPYRLNEVMQYRGQSGQTGGALPSLAPQTNPDGTLKFLNPGAGTPPPTSPGTTTPAIPPPATAPPGTAPELDPAEYRRKADLIANSTLLRREQQNLQDKQQEADDIRKMLTTGQISSSGLQMGNAIQPPRNLNPQEGEQYATRLLQLKKEIEQSQKKVFDLNNSSRALQPAPPAPTGPAYNWNPAPMANPFSTPGQSQPAPPTGQPQASNGQVDPMQYRAAQNQVAQTFGTSDPQVFQAAKNYAKSNLGMDDGTIQNLVQMAVKGDPNSIQTIKSIISKVQNSNGAIASTPPQMQPAGQPVSYAPQQSAFAA